MDWGQVIGTLNEIHNDLGLFPFAFSLEERELMSVCQLRYPTLLSEGVE